MHLGLRMYINRALGHGEELCVVVVSYRYPEFLADKKKNLFLPLA